MRWIFNILWVFFHVNLNRTQHVSSWRNKMQIWGNDEGKIKSRCRNSFVGDYLWCSDVFMATFLFEGEKDSNKKSKDTWVELQQRKRGERSRKMLVLISDLHPGRNIRPRDGWKAHKLWSCVICVFNFDIKTIGGDGGGGEGGFEQERVGHHGTKLPESKDKKKSVF